VSGKSKLPMSVQLVSLVALGTVVIASIQLYFLVALPQLGPPGSIVLESPQWATSVGVRIALQLIGFLAIGLAFRGAVRKAARVGVFLCLALWALVLLGLWGFLASESAPFKPEASTSLIFLGTRVAAAVFLVWLVVALKKTLRHYRAEI
jgi:Na+/proline symporter